MAKSLSLFHLLSYNLLIVLATDGVDWFGDPRGGPPPDAAAFYDITYDDDLCQDSELKSNAVPDYMYFGQMISASLIDDSSSCVRECYYNQQCRSVNYYRPTTDDQRGFCELLTETQWDNPSWMRPYKNAVYYEQIICNSHQEEPKNALPGPSPVKESATPLFLRRLFSKLSDFNKRTQRRRMT